jgi:spoIIIJ-associated protein
MGLEVKVEAKKREEYLKFNLFSNNNAILIGKNGKTLDSLQIIVRSSIQNSTGFKTNIIIDVEDYREKQIQNIERNIKSIAFEVKRTGVPVSLDPMNSYERRTVHSICGEISGITTESFGEEPERYITIKRKD